MSFLHYFSDNADRRSKYIFNTIAPIYALADGTLKNNYAASMELVKQEIDFNGLSILDVGTGTGAWAAMFQKNNAGEVHGVDFSDKMLAKARKKYPQVKFSIANAEHMENFLNNSFDIVTASYVIHGVKAESRLNMISEMKRISRKYIVVHDFVNKTPLFIRFLEFMEKSDYKNFKLNFCAELKTIFPKTRKISSVDGSGLYIATK